MDQPTPMLRELTVRYAVKTDTTGQPVPVGTPLTTPRDAADLLSRLLAEEASEVFAIVLLSTKHRVLAYHEVSRGTLNSTLVHPREVFKVAYLTNAAAVILARVHPSGDPTPSRDDIELTRRLMAAGALLGIDVLDHVVIGHARYASFKELGLL